MIIGLCSEKGGSGKSTLAINLAAELAKTGTTTLIDADSQATASQWASLRQTLDFKVIQPSTRDFLEKVESFESDHIVIDLPPRTERVFRSAMMVASNILIPMTASGADLWSSLDVLGLLPELSEARDEPFKVALVLSRWPARSKLARSVEQTVRDNPMGYHTPVMFGSSQRIAYAESLSNGQTVFEHDPNSVAAREMRELRTAVEEL